MSVIIIVSMLTATDDCPVEIHSGWIRLTEVTTKLHQVYKDTVLTLLPLLLCRN